MVQEADLADSQEECNRVILHVLPASLINQRHGLMQQKLNLLVLQVKKAAISNQTLILLMDLDGASQYLLEKAEEAATLNAETVFLCRTLRMLVKNLQKNAGGIILHNFA